MWVGTVPSVQRLNIAKEKCGVTLSLLLWEHLSSALGYHFWFLSLRIHTYNSGFSGHPACIQEIMKFPSFAKASSISVCAHTHECTHVFCFSRKLLLTHVHVSKKLFRDTITAYLLCILPLVLLLLNSESLYFLRN